MNFPLVEGSNLEQSLQLIKLSEPNNSFFYFREMHSLEAGKGCNTTGPFSTRNAQKRKYLCHLQHVLKGPHSSLCLYLPPLQQSQVLPGHHCWDWLPCLYWTEFFVWPVRTNKETTLNTSLEITTNAGKLSVNRHTVTLFIFLLFFPWREWECDGFPEKVPSVFTERGTSSVLSSCNI